MKTYRFYQDVKVTMWQRETFEIVANSEEEANKIAESFKNKEVCNSDYCYNVDSIYESSEIIPIENNNNQPTIEVYKDNGEMICDNSQL